MIAAAAGIGLAVDGCQAILGIDPDQRQVGDVQGVVDGSSFDAAKDSGADVVVISDAGDAGDACHVDEDCKALVKGACEKSTCDAGTCEIISRDGEKCVTDVGTCRGYACISNDVRFGAAGDTTCMLDAEGRVWCWGADANGQLGDRGSAARSTPYLVPRIGDDLPGAIQVSVGYDHACASLSNQSVVCWGANAYGQSSGSDAGGATLPIGPTVVDEAPVSELVVAGTGHTCAVGKLAGDVWCWGDNEVGELGVGSSVSSIARPSRIDLLSHVASLSGDAKTVCASDTNTLYCWGDNTWGQLGDDFGDSFSAHPIGIANLDGGPSGGFISQVAVTWGNVCVVADAFSNVWCWGNDRAGQMGNGRVGGFGDGGLADSPHTDPEAILGLDGSVPYENGFNVLGTGTHFCLQALFNGGFVCWGENATTELGTVAPRFNPQPFRPTSLVGAQQVVLGDAHVCMIRPEPDTYFISCVGEDGAGQAGDGLSIAARIQNDPVHVAFPSGPGGIAGVRARQ